MGGEPRFAGIDFSKARLDVAVRPTGKRWVLPYDEAGIEGLIPQIVDLEPALVLLEATGGLELPLVVALAAVRHCRWWWSTHGRSGTSPRPPERWPGPTLWTRGSWPISPTPSVLR